MNENLISEAIASVARDLSGRIERITKFAKQVEEVIDALRDVGVEVQVTKWDLTYQDAFDVKRADLPAIRKALGSLSVDGKCAASDFNTSNEIIVTVKPKAKDLDKIRFRYRSPFRAGGKCHVETQVSTYQSLVCRV